MRKLPARGCCEVATVLPDFCQLMVQKYGSPSSIKDGILAREFAAHFLLSSQPTLLEFHLLCNQLGIDMEARKLPMELGAHHYLDRTVGKYRLEYEQEQWVGTSEFKVAHDLYEIVQETFEKICPGYKAPRNPAHPTCMAPFANRFAAALVMNEELMSSSVVETGFDVVELHHRFCKAYSAVAIRAVEVLKDSPGDVIQVLFAIYERNEPERDTSLWGDCRREKFQAKYVAKTPGIRISRKRWGIRAPSYPRHLLPQRGDKVAPGSLVDDIINGAGPLYIERVWGFDLWGFNDLACLAVPVFWRRKNTFGAVLAKVILTVMPYEQATLLEPQLQKLKPDVIPERFQLI
jgi:hypothetical protein